MFVFVSENYPLKVIYERFSTERHLLGKSSLLNFNFIIAYKVLSFAFSYMMMTEDLKMTGYLPSPLKKIKIEMPSLPEIILPKTLPSKSNVERSQSSRFYRPVSSNNG